MSNISCTLAKSKTSSQTFKNQNIMKKERNHTFPKTYTTAGAVGRAKRNFEQRFPDKTFMVVRQEDKYVLEAVAQTQEVVMETETREIV